MLAGEEFEIEIQGLILKVSSHIVNNDEIFRIEFSDGRPQLIVHEATAGSRPFWTSIPQGRQREAEFFGARIADHYKK